MFDSVGLAELLRNHPGVALERIARGAGATRWFWLTSYDDLVSVAQRAAPGSVLTFYFDDRFAWRVLDDEVVDELLNLIAQAGDVVLGTLKSGGLELEVAFVAGLGELSEFKAGLEPSREVLCGAFPARDDDGVAAITVVLPDADGVVRPHPH